MGIPLCLQERICFPLLPRPLPRYHPPRHRLPSLHCAVPPFWPRVRVQRHRFLAGPSPSSSNSPAYSSPHAQQQILPHPLSFFSPLPIAALQPCPTPFDSPIPPRTRRWHSHTTCGVL